MRIPNQAPAVARAPSIGQLAGRVSPAGCDVFKAIGCAGALAACATVCVGSIGSACFQCLGALGASGCVDCL